MKLLRILLTVALTASLALAQSASESSAVRQQVDPAIGIHAFYRLNGQPTGRYQEHTVIDAEGRLATSVDSDLVFNRLGSKIEMTSKNQYNETPAGAMESLISHASSSEQPTDLSVEVLAGKLVIRTSTGGKSYQREVPFSGNLLGPVATRNETVSRLHSPGDSFSYQTFSPELGQVVTVSDVLMNTEVVQIDQQSIPALKLEQSMTSMPGKAIVWLDHQGWLFRQLTPSPFGDIETIRTSDITADSSVSTGAPLPDESFTRSIVKANVRLPEERLVERIRLKLVHRHPEFGWPYLEADNQRVIEKSADHVVLEITRLQPTAKVHRPAPKTPALAAYLAPNALLQADDESILNIASTIAGKETDAWQAAQALQQWTNQNMKFDLGIAVAPASEVVRNRRGTCFGYAMLLGSLTRAAGIPSRVRMGYVYAGGVWGGHAWIEVRIGNDWIPIDGALYSPGPADAARFSVFTSSLEDGTLNGIGALAQLFGNIDIQILQYTIGGKTVDLPDHASPFRIDGNTYRNPWLGLVVEKPSTFKFTGVNLSWPDKAVIVIEGPNGERITVEDLSSSLPVAELDSTEQFAHDNLTGTAFEIDHAGYKGILKYAANAAVVLLTNKKNVFLLRATGPDAKALLDKTLGSLALRGEL